MLTRNRPCTNISEEKHDFQRRPGFWRAVGPSHDCTCSARRVTCAASHRRTELATVTAMAIAATLRNYGDVTLTDQLQEALNSRSIIDRAIGIIVATQHISPVEAFTALRKQSKNGNTRLATIARQLVDGYTQAD